VTDDKPKRRLPIDWYLVALLATVGIAALIPARGIGATVMGYATYGAVALLFFLYGARLAPQAILAGVMHWRLQGLVFLSTFAVFPIVGLILVAIFRPWLGETLSLGLVVGHGGVLEGRSLNSPGRGDAPVPPDLRSATPANT
jgi:sodium/bile acid cotransporter 7